MIQPIKKTLVEYIDRYIMRHDVKQLSARQALYMVPQGNVASDVMKALTILSNRGRIVWISEVRVIRSGRRQRDTFQVVKTPIGESKARQQLLHLWEGFRPDSPNSVDRKAFYDWARLLSPESMSWPIADDADREAIIASWLQEEPALQEGEV